MKCDKCFFCTKIGAGVLTDYPLKFCKRVQAYQKPFVAEKDSYGQLRIRKLDFSDAKDCKIWGEVGCDIHPATVAKAKRDYIKKLEEAENERIYS